jgi:hypothetical protein
MTSHQRIEVDRTIERLEAENKRLTEELKTKEQLHQLSLHKNATFVDRVAALIRENNELKDKIKSDAFK